MNTLLEKVDYRELDPEVVRHLGHLGYSLADIDKMTMVEVEEHCITEEDVDQDWQDLQASRGQY